MKPLTAGVTKANEGIDAISWNILGQTYVPKMLSEDSFSWHATFPPGTFVPPHIHPTQDEFIYMLEGRLDLVLDGQESHALPGDLIKLPRNIPHGLFNKSDAPVKCLFWVAPTAASTTCSGRSIRCRSRTRPKSSPCRHATRSISCRRRPTEPERAAAELRLRKTYCCNHEH